MSNSTAPPAQSHSKTSIAAASSLGPSRMRIAQRVLNHLRAAGLHGATDAELQETLALDGSTQRPRRIELLRRGLIADSGRKRRGPSGRLATVWIACDAGGGER